MRHRFPVHERSRDATGAGVVPKPDARHGRRGDAEPNRRTLRRRHRLLRHVVAEDDRDRRVGAARRELSNRVQDTFGDVLYNIYASTECGFATIATPAELRSAPGTAGRTPVTSEVVPVRRARPPHRRRQQAGPDLHSQRGAFRGIHRSAATSSVGSYGYMSSGAHGPLRRERTAVSSTAATTT